MHEHDVARERAQRLASDMALPPYFTTTTFPA